MQHKEDMKCSSSASTCISFSITACRLEAYSHLSFPGVQETNMGHRVKIGNWFHFPGASLYLKGKFNPIRKKTAEMTLGLVELCCLDLSTKVH